MASPDFDASHPSNSVSVVIPVYNGARFIAETLKSVLAQTVPPKEVIVVNDGSTDNTLSVVEKFRDAVTVISIQNGGASAARNLGASMAKGNWLAFCDADDLWLPTKLKKQLRLTNDAPDIHCVLTDYADITSGAVSERTHFSWAPKDFWVPEHHSAGFVVRQSITGKLTTFQPGITSAPIVKKCFFQQAGGFDVKATNWADDTCFHFRCLSVVPFGVVPEVLMHYRRHPDSLSANQLKQLRDTVTVWNHIIAKYPEAQPYRAELLQGLVAMRKEIREMEGQRWRKKLKHLLGLS